MSFLIKDDELLEKHHRIWNKVSNSIKKQFDSETVYNEKLKTKIQSMKVKSAHIFMMKRRRFSLHLPISNID